MIYAKRRLLIFNERIFDSNVDGGIPSLAAVPDAPDTRPLLSASAASIISFSCDTSLWGSGWVTWGMEMAFRDNQLSSTEKFSVSHKMTDRSITFRNSTNISRPGVRGKAIQGLPVYAVNLLAGITIEEILDQKMRAAKSRGRAENIAEFFVGLKSGSNRSVVGNGAMLITARSTLTGS